MAAPTNYYVDYGAGDDATGTGAVGTPWKTIQHALDTITQGASGDQINIKAGAAQVLGAALSLATYGTPASDKPLIFRGYTSAANDGGKGEISGADTYQIFASTTINYLHWIDLTIGNAKSGAVAVMQVNDYCQFINCDINANNGSAKSAYCIDCDIGCLIAGCHLEGSYYMGLSLDNSCVVLGNYIEHPGESSAAAISGLGRSFVTVMGNIVVVTDTRTTGITIEGSTHTIVGNVVYATVANTQHGIFASEGHIARVNSIVANNIVCGFSGAGANGIEIGLVGLGGFVGHNAFYNNTSDYNGGTYVYDATAGDVALTADPFTDAANGDFSLTTAAKTALAAAGFPTSYLGAAAGTVPNLNIGPIQLAAAAGGGGGFPKIASLLGRTRM